MSLLVLVALVQAAGGTPPVPAASEEAVAAEIAGIDRKLGDWRGGIYKRDGKLACNTQVSSGDPAVDIIRCAAMLKCYAPQVAELDRIAESDANRNERVAQIQAIAEQVKPCVSGAEEEGVRRLAMTRAAK